MLRYILEITDDLKGKEIINYLKKQESVTIKRMDSQRMSSEAMKSYIDQQNSDINELGLIQKNT